MAANNKYAQEGDVVTIVIEAGERVKATTILATVAGVSSAGNDANKPTISLGADDNGNADQKITVTKVMSSSDSEGYIPFLSHSVMLMDFHMIMVVQLLQTI